MSLFSHLAYFDIIFHLWLYVRLQTPEVAPQTTESPATTAAAPPAATDGEQAAAPVAETANASEDAENGSSVSRTDGCAASADGAAAVEAADAAAAVHNGNAATGSGSSNGGGGGLFGSVLKGTSAFVSPFSSLVRLHHVFPPIHLQIPFSAGSLHGLTPTLVPLLLMFACGAGCNRKLLLAAFYRSY